MTTNSALASSVRRISPSPLSAAQIWPAERGPSRNRESSRMVFCNSATNPGLTIPAVFTACVSLSRPMTKRAYFALAALFDATISLIVCLVPSSYRGRLITPRQPSGKAVSARRSLPHTARSKDGHGVTVQWRRVDERVAGGSRVAADVALALQCFRGFLHNSISCAGDM